MTDKATKVIGILRQAPEPASPARVLFLIESNARMRVALEQAIEVFEALNEDEINMEILPMLRAAIHD
ncbi:hypothetical protein ACRQ5Q_16660 [Bradyrhizobium sp. PMVTL-01]|uniref:hypothetical protein n=1 Tax=Bradyrhizobium sp. PMVTL-01 TaxID=3434999 RepID=UPI003F6E4A3C